VLLKAEPQPVAPAKKSDPGRTQPEAPAFDLDSLRQSRKPSAPPAAPHAPAADAKRIDASLEGLRPQQVKREAPGSQMRKIEDDIARKFEDTLSGLGLHKKPAAPAQPTVVLPPQAPRPVPPPPPAPAAPPIIKLEPTPPYASQDKVMVKEIHETIQDEIIELGEESLRVDLPPAKAPEAAPARKPSPAAAPPPRVMPEPAAEAREAKPEKIAPPADNPNEVGDYVLLGMIARGGMAEIYKAKKKGVKGFEKVIAIKKILSGYGEDDKYIEMLVDEAKIAAELSHPNIVQIYDLGRKDNYYFIAMEYVLGKDLREIQTRLRERDQWFPEEIAILLTIKILEALNYAHKAKDSRGRPLEIVHRDVSPPNILISYNGEVKLTDFGVSKAAIKIHQTLSGALKGKLLYMSPEQACGESGIDYRSDLYSAGVVLFELLTGKKLFLDTTEMMVLKRVQNGEIIPPREINPDIDPALEKILLTSLSKECDKRYQSAAAMIADLEAYVHKKYDRAPGPVHLSHFIYGLFESDIHREGIKVDLKPLPYSPKVREIPKPPPPPEKPKPIPEVPLPPAVTLPPVPPPAPPPGAISISFDEEKAPARGKKTTAQEKDSFKPESLFHELEKEKKKFPVLPLAVLLLVVAVGAGLYFLVFNKPASKAAAADRKPAAQTAGPTAAAGTASGLPAPATTQTPAMKQIADELAATQKLLDEAKLKQEEELMKIQAEEERKKLLEERRKKTEAERLKKEEEDRLKLEEAARLQQEEDNRKKQEEADRLKKEEEDRRKADELKRAEQNRVKEGDIVPMNSVDTQPVAVSTPGPNIPASVRSSMQGDQTLMFTLLINHNGDVETVRILQKSNIGQLNTIISDLLKTWKYQPATKDSLRVKVWKTVPMTIKK
jgi:serine/threonine protein kinase